MKKIVIATLALTLSTVAFAAKLPNIDGNYVCSVNDNTMKAHNVTGKFALKQNGKYYEVIQLDNKTNKPIANEFTIFGMRLDNTLSLTFQKINDAAVFGNEVMTISKDGKELKGTFIYANDLQAKNTEICKRF